MTRRLAASFENDVHDVRPGAVAAAWHRRWLVSGDDEDGADRIGRQRIANAASETRRRAPAVPPVSRETGQRAGEVRVIDVREERLRDELVDVVPDATDDTPLAQELAADARRRIALVGRPLPKPRHTRLMTLANQKGGVGKTTTAVNLAGALAQGGLQVLVIDIDPQGNASTALGIEHHGDVPGTYDVLVDGTPIADVVQQCPDLDGVSCVPATVDLSGAEIELVPGVAREYRLRRALESYLATTPARPDYVLVDCPPSLGLLTLNALVAVDEVLVPIQCEYYALEGLAQLLRTVELVQGALNPSLDITTVLLTMYDGRTRLASDVAEQVRATFGDKVLRSAIPRSVRLSEAPSHLQTVMTYDPTSSGALSYLEAAREMCEKGTERDG